MKTAVITGGNSGIGFETAKALAHEGWRVVITGRDEGRLAIAAAKIERAMDPGNSGEVAVRIGDFTSFDSVRTLAHELEAEPRIDALINNIGISLSAPTTTEDGNNIMVQVNHLSHFLLTILLLEKLKASAPARIINVSSRLHRQTSTYGFDDFQMESSFATLSSYARTKLYNILFTHELAARLEGTGVTVNALHPGILATNIGDFKGILGYAWTASKLFQKPQFLGARVPKFLATSPKLEAVTGKYFSRGLREVTPSRLARQPEAARRLWKISADLTGVGK